MKRSQIMLLCCAAMLLALGGCGDGGNSNGDGNTGGPAAANDGGKDAKKNKDGNKANQQEPVRIVFMTNMVHNFWLTAQAGVRDAEKAFNVECDVMMPAGPDFTGDQKQKIETVLAKDYQGLAISPSDAANQVDLINQVCERMPVVTHDTDAPQTDRLCFIGMHNYKAGREAGKLVRQALPDGGKVMIFVGRLEQLNAQQRRQGVIDELLNRPVQSMDNIRYDPADARNLYADGSDFVILDTRTDGGDTSKAKQNAEDALATHADLDCMVGLFAYNAPQCLLAVKAADKTGDVKIVSFDEEDDTLQGIVDGHVVGTISQQPYYYGYESVRILAELIRGEKPRDEILPENGYLDVPVKIVTKDNVVEFSRELKRMRASVTQQ